MIEVAIAIPESGWNHFRSTQGDVFLSFSFLSSWLPLDWPFRLSPTSKTASFWTHFVVNIIVEMIFGSFLELFIPQSLFVLFLRRFITIKNNLLNDLLQNVQNIFVLIHVVGKCFCILFLWWQQQQIFWMLNQIKSSRLLFLQPYPKMAELEPYFHGNRIFNLLQLPT